MVGDGRIYETQIPLFQGRDEDSDEMYLNATTDIFSLMNTSISVLVIQLERKDLPPTYPCYTPEWLPDMSCTVPHIIYRSEEKERRPP